MWNRSSGIVPGRRYRLESICAREEKEVKLPVAQSCPTLCNPMDYSLPVSSVHRIFQTRILEWTAIPFSRGPSPPRVRTQVSCIAGRFFTIWASREAHQRRECPANSASPVCTFLLNSILMPSCGRLELKSWRQCLHHINQQMIQLNSFCPPSHLPTRAVYWSTTVGRHWHVCEI